MIVGSRLGFFGEAGFPVQAVTFDGSNDYLSRGSDLTGNADGKEGTVSFWVKINGSDSGINGQNIYTTEPGGGAENFIKKDSSNKIEFIWKNSSGPSVERFLTSSSYTISNGWFHVLASWDIANDVRHLYIDDVSDLVEDTQVNQNIDYTLGNHIIGADKDGNDKLNADLAEFYFAQEYIDLSVTANRRKFITASGLPVNLGADGSTPTGNQPIIYLSNRPGDAASDFVTNRGGGGNFTENGALAVASTSPSD